MGMKSVLALSAALAVAAGCTDRGPKEIGGAVIGGAAGGLLGSQIGSGTGQLVATAAGVFLGAWLGSEIGRSLDENDRREAERSAQVALERNPDGKASTWQNPNSGHSAPPRRREPMRLPADPAASTRPRSSSMARPRRRTARPAASPTAPGAS